MAPAPPQPGRLARLADLAFRRRRAVVATWVVALAAAFAAAGLAGDWSADYSTPGLGVARRRAAPPGPLPGQQPGHRGRRVAGAGGAADPAVQARIDRLARDAAGLEGIGRPPAAATADVSRDGTIGVLRLPMTELPGAVPPETGERLIALAERAGGDGVRIELGGQVIANAEGGEISSEIVGLAIAAFVLLLTFGSVVAAGLPLATALFGLGISSALIGGLAAAMDVPDWAPALASMLGIGVGIDYALLIITRYRAALGAGRDPRAAVAEAVTTAGRSVLIAGTTVVISLVGLFLMGLPYLYGAALATIVSVVVVMAASVTLVPALMGDGGHADRPPAHPGHEPAGGRSGHGAGGPLGSRRPAPAVDGRPRGRGRAARPRLPVRRAPARLPRPRQRRGGHHDAPGLRPRLAGLRAGRQRPAPARRGDARAGRPRRHGRTGRAAARGAGRRGGRPARGEPGPQCHAARRHAGHARRRTRRPRA